MEEKESMEVGKFTSVNEAIIEFFKSRNYEVTHIENDRISYIDACGMHDLNINLSEYTVDSIIPYLEEIVYNSKDDFRFMVILLETLHYKLLSLKMKQESKHLASFGEHYPQKLEYVTSDLHGLKELSKELDYIDYTRSIPFEAKINNVYIDQYQERLKSLVKYCKDAIEPLFKQIQFDYLHVIEETDLANAMCDYDALQKLIKILENNRDKKSEADDFCSDIEHKINAYKILDSIVARQGR